MLHEHFCHAVQFPMGHAILKPAHRRLGGQGHVVWRPADTHFQDAVVSEVIAIIRILIPRGYLQDTLLYQLGNAMDQELLIAPLGDERCEFVEQATFFVCLGNKCHSAKIGQLRGCKTNLHGFFYVENIRKERFLLFV